MTTRRRDLALPLATIACCVWLGIFAGARGLSLAAYLLAAFAACIDMFDLVLRAILLRSRSEVVDARERSPETLPADPLANGDTVAAVPLRPYAILLSVHDLEGMVDEFMDAMAPWRDRTYIIDDCSNDLTVLRLRAERWRCLPARVNRKKPGALLELVRSLPRDIDTVIVLDPDSALLPGDTDAKATLRAVLVDFQASGAAALCPRVSVAPSGWLTAIQSFEYALSFCIGRGSLGSVSITSGLAVYRRHALTKALSRHSLSVYAEDLENSLILLGADQRIYYDTRLTVTTQGPETVRSWFSQRVGWSYGFVKVFIERRRELRAIARRGPVAFYHYIVYMTGLSILSLPAKILGFGLLVVSFTNGLDDLLGLHLIADNELTSPLLFAIVYLKFIVLAGTAVLLGLPRGERLRMLAIVPIYFFYAVAGLVPTTVGFFNWIGLRVFSRRLYADHYQQLEPVRTTEA